MEGTHNESPIPAWVRAYVLQHLSAEQLAAILDVAEDGIITVNAEHRIVLFNRGASRLFGYEPAEVLGQPLNILIPPTYHQSHPQQMEAFARGPVESRRMASRRTVFGQRKDGTLFPAEVTISKLYSQDQWYLTAIVRNAEERKRYEDALIQLNQELEERIQLRTAELAERNRQLQEKTTENEMFVYSVSHDLRSPLINLMGFSEELEMAVNRIEELLGDPRLPPDIGEAVGQLLQGEVKESLGYIRTAVERLSRIIDGLLRLSRVGRVEYRWQVVDMERIVQRVIAAHHAMIQRNQTEVIVEPLPPAWADPDAVEQVVANLLVNALQALESRRGGRIVIGSRPGDAPGRFLYFVADNGPGIEPALLPRLFQPFQGKAGSNSGRKKGEGIGLAIVQRVIERLGGQVGVESTVGSGTTFSFTLAQPGESPPPPSHHEKEAPAHPHKEAPA